MLNFSETEDAAKEQAKKDQKEKDRQQKAEEKKHICMKGPTTWIASVVREGGFRLYKGGNWDTETVTREYAYEYADSKHPSRSERYCISVCKNYVHALYTDLLPGEKQVFKDADGDIGLNTYIPPTLAPSKEGHHDSVNKILKVITGNVPGGAEYFEDWCAAKVQNPGVRSNSAILFHGTQQTGKGSITRALSECLGDKNCSIIDSKDLENQAGNNGAFIDRLFTNINEVNMRDERMSDIIKNMIDGATVKLRDKYIRTGKNGITNRNSFIFTTNIDNSVKLDAFDRRFTVFDDGIPQGVTADYRAFVMSLWDPKTKNASDAFSAEMSHWMYHLQHKVLSDARLRELQVPFPTEARDRLIRRTQSTSKDFFDAEMELGIDTLLDEYFDNCKQRSFNYIQPSRDKYIFPERGTGDLDTSTTIAERILFEAYVFYTNKYSPSKHATNKQAFLEAAKDHGWSFGGKASKGTVRVVRGVKRSEKVIKDHTVNQEEADVVSIDAKLKGQGF